MNDFVSQAGGTQCGFGAAHDTDFSGSPRRCRSTAARSSNGAIATCSVAPRSRVRKLPPTFAGSGINSNVPACRESRERLFGTVHRNRSGSPLLPKNNQCASSTSNASISTIYLNQGASILVLIRHPMLLEQRQPDTNPKISSFQTHHLYFPSTRFQRLQEMHKSTQAIHLETY